jgi:hypothetical protein
VLRKSVKRLSSWWVVPIHPLLVKIGFVDFRRAACSRPRPTFRIALGAPRIDGAGTRDSACRHQMEPQDLEMGRTSVAEA